MLKIYYLKRGKGFLASRFSFRGLIILAVFATALLYGLTPLVKDGMFEFAMKNTMVDIGEIIKLPKSELSTKLKILPVCLIDANKSHNDNSNCNSSNIWHTKFMREYGGLRLYLGEEINGSTRTYLYLEASFHTRNKYIEQYITKYLNANFANELQTIEYTATDLFGTLDGSYLDGKIRILLRGSK